jgi:hypothetical protein
MADALDRLTSIGNRVERACRLLESPRTDELESCTRLLEAARAELEVFRDSLPGGKASLELLAAAHGLARKVRCASLLLASASDYHAKWQQFLGSMTGGYEPGGQPAVYTPRSSMSIRG